jgi:MYXO-CTERM domain-containing protein
MNAGNKMLRPLLLAGILLAASAGVARAAANPTMCANDIDCIATPSCGGDVCDYGAGETCQPAGGASKGHDGWCDPTHGDDDCKCKALGAKCVGVYCTFTKPSDAPSGGAGTTGTAGAGTTGAAGAGTAGTPGTAGTTGTAGASTTGAAGTGASSSSSSGGCSVTSTSTSGGLAALVGLALVAGRIVRRRRRA